MFTMGIQMTQLHQVVVFVQSPVGRFSIVVSDPLPWNDAIESSGEAQSVLAEIADNVADSPSLYTAADLDDGNVMVSLPRQLVTRSVFKFALPTAEEVEKIRALKQQGPQSEQFATR